jgi:hypothetical protein
MQNALLAQTYPDKIVPPNVMKYAKSLYDILDCVRCNFVDDTLALQYIYNWTLIKLWHCSLLMKWDQCIISNFYTANLRGIDERFKTRTQAANDVHVLQFPIKYIWKEIFGKILDICHKNNIYSIKLSPLSSTDSPVFYSKMQKYFPEYISTISTDQQWDMIFMLK